MGSIGIIIIIIGIPAAMQSVIFLAKNKGKDRNKINLPSASTNFTYLRSFLYNNESPVLHIIVVKVNTVTAELFHNNHDFNDLNITLYVMQINYLFRFSYR